MRPKTFGIVSAKGGVGKTAVALNTALAMAKTLRKRVLVIDANIEAPALALYLGIRDSLPLTIPQIIKNKMPLDDAAFVHSKTGLHIIPGSLTAIEEPGLEGLKEEVQNIKNYDAVLIDTGAGIGSDVKNCMLACDELLLVANPWAPIVTLNLKTMKLAHDLNIPLKGVVLNKTKRSEMEMTVKEVEEALGLKVIASIPVDQKLYTSVEMKSPLMIEFPDSPAGKEFRKLAELLLR